MWQKTKKTRYNQFSVDKCQMLVLQVIGVKKCKERVMTKYLSSLVITLLITNQLVHYQLVKCISDEWWLINQNIGFYTWVCFSVYHTFQWLVGMSDLYCSKVIGTILKKGSTGMYRCMLVKFGNRNSDNWTSVFTAWFTFVRGFAGHKPDNRITL